MNFHTFSTCHLVDGKTAERKDRLLLTAHSNSGKPKTISSEKLKKIANRPQPIKCNTSISSVEWRFKCNQCIQSNWRENQQIKRYFIIYEFRCLLFLCQTIVSTWCRLSTISIRRMKLQCCSIFHVFALIFIFGCSLLMSSLQSKARN